MYLTFIQIEKVNKRKYDLEGCIQIEKINTTLGAVTDPNCEDPSLRIVLDELRSTVRFIACCRGLVQIRNLQHNAV
jgi:hypothetical protein